MSKTSTEFFIEKAATESSASGKPSEGQTPVKSAIWFNAALAQYRGKENHCQVLEASLT